MKVRCLGYFAAVSLGLAWGVTALGADLIGFDQEHVRGEFFVKYKDGTPKMKGLKAGLQAATVKAIDAQQGIVFVKLDPTKDGIHHLSQITDLQSDPNIEYIEANNVWYLQFDESQMKSSRAVESDDPSFDDLYGMAKVSAPAAWETTVGSRDVVVAVIDTGVDYTHEDLADNIYYNPGETGLDADGNDKSTNGIDDDGNGYVDDFRGWDFFNNDNDPMDGHAHGTHCAGSIGAVGNNGVGVVGVNWEVSIMPLKIFSDGGSTTTEAIVNAIKYSTANGATLTSNSWGGGQRSEVIYSAIEEAGEAGIPFIAAAGNGDWIGRPIDTDATPHYPSAYDLDNIIAVSASDENDELASFSNYGATTVDLAAPGVKILSTVPPESSFGNGRKYAEMSGTSMAAPHVAGGVALLLSANPELTSFDLKTALLEGTDYVSAFEGKLVTGGRMNVLNAVEFQ